MITSSVVAGMSTADDPSDPFRPSAEGYVVFPNLWHSAYRSVRLECQEHRDAWAFIYHLLMMAIMFEAVRTNLPMSVLLFDILHVDREETSVLRLPIVQVPSKVTGRSSAELKNRTKGAMCSMVGAYASQNWEVPQPSVMLIGQVGDMMPRFDRFARKPMKDLRSRVDRAGRWPITDRDSAFVPEASGEGSDEGSAKKAKSVE